MENIENIQIPYGKGQGEIDTLDVEVDIDHHLFFIANGAMTHNSNVDRYANGKDLKCAGNVIEIPYETVINKKQKLHPDRFPVGLPFHFLKLSGIKNRSQNPLVLDPFGGSGTTGLACKQQDIDFVLIEKNPIYLEIIKKRLNFSLGNIF